LQAALAAYLADQVATSVDLDARLTELLPDNLDRLAAPIAARAQRRRRAVARAGAATPPCTTRSRNWSSGPTAGRCRCSRGDGLVDGVNVSGGEVSINLLPLVGRGLTALQSTGLLDDVVVPELTADGDPAEQVTRPAIWLGWVAAYSWATMPPLEWRPRPRGRGRRQRRGGRRVRRPCRLVAGGGGVVAAGSGDVGLVVAAYPGGVRDGRWTSVQSLVRPPTRTTVGSPSPTQLRTVGGGRLGTGRCGGRRWPAARRARRRGRSIRSDGMVGVRRRGRGRRHGVVMFVATSTSHRLIVGSCLEGISSAMRSSSAITAG
jgi:hypothetical protein